MSEEAGEDWLECPRVGQIQQVIFARFPFLVRY